MQKASMNELKSDQLPKKPAGYTDLAEVKILTPYRVH